MGLYEEGIIKKEDLSSRLAKLNEERCQLEDRINPIWNILNEDTIQQVFYELVKETMKKFNEVILNSSSRGKKKQLIYLLINEITVGENRNVEIIKIRLNEEEMTYLNITKGKELSFRWLFFCYIHESIILGKCRSCTRFYAHQDKREKTSLATVMVSRIINK